MTTQERLERYTFTEDQIREWEISRTLEKAFEPEPIHLHFELSYCNYNVLPRSVLQSMPVEWQRKFVQLIEQIPETLDLRGMPYGYHVLAINERNQFVRDRFSDYERGRRRVPTKANSEDRE